MVHLKPKDVEREALYGWFIGREINAENLPEIVRNFEKFKAGETSEVPNIPFQMLTALPLTTTIDCHCAKCALANDANESQHISASRHFLYAGNR